jgi:hypothetical protein
MPFGNESTWDSGSPLQSNGLPQSHQCLSAMSPLGTRALACQNAQEVDVTNAFRQLAHLGTQARRRQARPAGTVTNAFRQQVHLGHYEDYQEQRQAPCHQCLSATSPLGTGCGDYQPIAGFESPMPFGNESTWDTLTECGIRLRGKRHQCLSATSPLGT